jgi:probable rRNA maturation factor
MLSIDICSEQDALEFDEAPLRKAALAILNDAGVRQGSLSIAVVDDPAIHQLNRQYLQHDYPTDVLSFVLERDGDRLEGEVIVSADTAIRTAAQLGWPSGNELLLYVIHGTLHLVGYDDLEPELQTKMREQERTYLARFGLTPPTP